jgi:hypothetical protein
VCNNESAGLDLQRRLTEPCHFSDSGRWTPLPCTIVT